MARPDRAQSFPDRELLALCEQFSLWLRQGGGLAVRGRPLPGGDASGIDFEGFAEYAPGMDLRHLDWRIWARIRRLFVRTFADEGEGVLAVLLDGSGSMAVGAPPKWILARQLAAALAFAGLREVRAVLIGVAHGDRLEALPLAGGISFAQSAFDFLARQRPEGATDLRAALGELPTGLLRGDAVVIGDFLDPRGAGAGVEALRRAGWRLDLIRVRAPGEFELPPAGSALHDPEGAGHRLVPSEPAARARLQAAIEAHRAQLTAVARRWGSPLVEISSEEAPAVALTRFFQAISAGRGRRALPAS